MSAYIPIPKYCRSRGYIRNTYYTGLNMVGGRLFFDKAVENVSEFSIFPGWFFTKLRTKTKELDIVVDDPELITYFDRIAESWKEIDEELHEKTYRLKNSRYFDFAFDFALSEVVEPEIWISREGNKIKLVQNSDYTNETFLNTLEIRSNLMLRGLSPDFRYGAVPSIIRTRPEKKQTTSRSLLAWVYKDNTLTKILPKKTSDPDEAVICFDNELNNASMKVGESKLVEICFDYTRRVPC